MEEGDEELVLALQLQEEWDARRPSGGRSGPSGPSGPPSGAEAPLSPVDAAWELLDPTPDLRALFVHFNQRFFWGRLAAVEVKWSPRMTLCAGLCSYEGWGGMCSIRLSEPLLKLRPRKDLVETLLHEMIHAYLFVTHNDKDREGHGPEFCKHMHRINRLTGANVTIYHTFHDEVDQYRQHWWRCDGPCRHRNPYFGYVKRATNRAPSAQDFWWEEHQRTCGGSYVKVKEPEGYAQKGKAKTKAPGQLQAPSGAGGTPSRPVGSPQPVTPFSGKGYLLGGSSSTSRPTSTWPGTGGLGDPKPAGPRAPQSGTPRPGGQQSVLNFPKISVANRHTFCNVDGSPRKGPAGVALGTGDGLPPKRPRLEDRTAFANYFTKKTPPSSTGVSGGAQPVPLPAPASPSPPTLTVRCPVCQMQLPESQINTHLDSCLTG
ncbi:DNA-dependent metalloprotease SPRTN [Tachyglossus aculeatus]|uniref:DNA-dependent metalloprotease SPRTN n=1 Tax=Tachyglossus aculeatus TaxID=9261 RepID=UPI0018F7C567|nr:DNA-dependent metalloprotease SPRTN [Tachyglossus aculeatus]